MYVRLNGKRIFCDVLNDGLKSAGGGRNIEKPVLFALHGGPGMEHSGMKPFLSPFFDLAQVVVFDQRGSGMSESVSKEEWSMKLLSMDIEGLKNHLGFNKIILMGISFGGMLALNYALTFPESLQGLILIATAPGRGTFKEAEDFASGIKDRKLKESAFKLLYGKIADDDDLKKTLAEVTPLYSAGRTPSQTLKALEHVKVSSSVLKRFLSGEAEEYDLEDRLNEINVPTLILGSSSDWICPLSQSEIMNRKIFGSELVVFRKSKHELFNDEKQKYVTKMRKFLGKFQNSNI